MSQHSTDRRDGGGLTRFAGGRLLSNYRVNARCKAPDTAQVFPVGSSVMLDKTHRGTVSSMSLSNDCVVALAFSKFYFFFGYFKKTAIQRASVFPTFSKRAAPLCRHITSPAFTLTSSVFPSGECRLNTPPFIKYWTRSGRSIIRLLSPGLDRVSCTLTLCRVPKQGS